jgi:nicotinamidase-related amidase
MVGFGERPALLMVDLYRGAFGDEPEPLLESVKKWPASCGLAGWETLPHARRLLTAAREAGIPVMHVTGWPQEESGVMIWTDAHRGGVSRRFGANDEAAKDRYRRRYDILPEVAPIPGEVVLRKGASSAFWGTPLMFELNRRGSTR